MKPLLVSLRNMWQRRDESPIPSAPDAGETGSFDTSNIETASVGHATDRFTDALLWKRTWRLERDNGDIVAKHLRLLQGGRMSGFRHTNEYRWGLVDGSLAFFNDAGQRTTVFAQVDEEAAGRLVLRGKFLLPPFESVVHVLREIDPLGVEPPLNGEGIGLEGAPSGRRRNLVVLRANEASLHNDWNRDIADEDRSWDLCVSWYGDPANLPPASAQEFFALQPEFRKFSAIHRLFFHGSPLWNYDFIMLPDDDLMLTWKDLNRSFELCREHRLELAQPSLREGSYWGLALVLKQPDTVLRFTSFVESMMPIFSREALEICLPTFPQSIVGWGIDVVWPVLLGSRKSNVAIFDSVSVLHTRPVGASYNGTEADQSGASVIKLYGVRQAFDEYGRIRM